MESRWYVHAIIALVIITIFSKSHAVECRDTNSQELARTYYINGISTSEDDAERNLDELDNVLNFSADFPTIEKSHSDTEGLLLDFWEAAEQKMVEDGAES